MLPLSQVTTLLLKYKYAFLFPVAVIEGPVISLLAGFLASRGLLDPVLAWLVVVGGDVVGDTVYYSIGRFGGRPFIRKWGHLFGIKKNHLADTEKLFRDHSAKTLFLGKINALGGIILVGGGFGKMPYWKFIGINTSATLIKSFLLVAAGYYFGEGYALIAAQVNNFGMVVSVITVVALAIYWGRKRLGKKI